MINLLGIHFTVLLGPKVPVPAPPNLLEAVEEVEVTHSEDHASAFRITLRIGRSSPLDLIDYSVLANPLLLKPWNRVVLLVTFGIVPQVLMDGFITHHELAPGNDSGTSRLTVIGEDSTVRMDLREVTAEHPGQPEHLIASKLLLAYAQYGVIPNVKTPPTVDVPLPTERTPVQQCSDLAYLRDMAARYGYVFHVTPGPAPGTSTAYWGPAQRSSQSQGTLSVNMGAQTNVEKIDFSHNPLGPVLVEGQVQDRSTNKAGPVLSVGSQRPPLSGQPTWQTPKTDVRTSQARWSGLTTAQALARAQGKTDASSDSVEGHGELDALRYGAILEARRLVDVRGVGNRFNGRYAVKSVTHHLRVGSYTQSFTLTRDGVGSLIQAVS
ncbi:MAG TPA: hypothetical protein VGQ28_12630 [Thermoanaerobaculia bacterium]|jgi:hypothetical protein|nr:hypothetical protein [Thermoanaerobaculia bacterium]